MKSKSWDRWLVYLTKEYELNPSNLSDLILFGIVRIGVPVQIEIGKHPTILSNTWAKILKTTRNGRKKIINTLRE
jgi:hypothetical protein